MRQLQRANYGWDPALLEKLANVDPYCHIDITQNGKKVKAHAPALVESKDGAKALEYILYHTKSNVPILTAEWFFNQTAVQQDRTVGYYDLLQIKTLEEFDKLVGFDRKLADTFGQALRDAVAISTVTLQPRGILRENTLGGAKWSSFDFKKARGLQNPLRIIGKDVEKNIDATEIFAHLPNGFWVMFLADGKGVRQDVAPGFIANNTSPHNKSTDKQVHINVTCLECHTSSGLKSIDGWFREHYSKDPTVGSLEYDKQFAFRREYLRDIELSMKRDKERFDVAVKEATGWSARRYLSKYLEYWNSYEHAVVDLEWAAKALAVTPECLKQAILATTPGPGKQIDPRFGAPDTVLEPLARGGKIGIVQWEEVYHLARMAVLAHRRTP